MTAFIFFAGLLLAGALLLILPPLLGIAAGRANAKGCDRAGWHWRCCASRSPNSTPNLPPAASTLRPTPRAARSSSAARWRKARPRRRSPIRPMYAPAAAGRSAWRCHRAGAGGRGLPDDRCARRALDPENVEGQQGFSRSRCRRWWAP